MLKVKCNLGMLFWVMLLLLLSGCNKTFSPGLREVDKILFVDYERGEKMLDSIRMANPNMPKSDRMYCELLQLKADDKAYRPIVNKKKRIDSLVSFFQNADDSDLLSEAYFYAGRVYYEIGDNPESLKFYQKASEKVGEENYSLQGDIYCQMANIYYFTDLYPDALKALKLAYRADSLSGNTRNILYDLRDIGDNYCAEMNFGKAINYYLKGLKDAENLKDSIMQRDFHHCLAAIYVKQQKWNLAQYHVNGYVHNMEDFQDKSGMLVTALRVYSNAGDNMMKEWCKKRIFIEGNTSAKQYATENTLLEKKIMGRKTLDSLLYSYKCLTDSVVKEKNAIAVKRAEQSYNYELKEIENTNLRFVNYTKNIVLALILVIVMLLALYFYLRIKNMKQRQIILEFKMTKLGELRERSEIKTKEKLTTEHAKIESSDIYSIIIKEIETGGCRLSEEHWQQLKVLVCEVYPDFDKNLHAFLLVSLQEYKICLLIKIGITPTNIAHFMNLSKEAVTASRRRMYQKAFKKKGSPSDWDKIIYSL